MPTTNRLLVYGNDADTTQHVSEQLARSDIFEFDVADDALEQLLQDRADNWNWDAVIICAGEEAPLEVVELLRSRIGFCPIVVVQDLPQSTSQTGYLSLPSNEFSPGTLKLFLQAARELRAANSKLVSLEATAAIKTGLLAQQNEFVHDLISRMCHEVRSPLTAARQFTTLLSRRQGDDRDGPALADRVLRNLDDLSMLVDDLSGMSHWNVQHRGLRRRPCAVDDILGEIEPLLRERARTENSELRIRTTGSPPEIFADPDAVAHVIRNLVVNALLHASDGECVTLSVHPASIGQVEFRVEDQFPTEDEEGMQDAFREFCESEISLDAGANRRRRGMSVAYRLLHMSLSELKLEALGDQGSAFAFQLPVAQPELLVHHYLKVLRVRQPRAKLSLLTLNAQCLGDFLPTHAIDEFLKTSSTSDDLVLQTGPLSWTALLCGTRHELNGRLRLLDSFWAMRRERDSWLNLPALRWQQHGSWLLESSQGTIASEFLSACGAARSENANARRVLVVDNHPERILRLTHQLEAAGYDVVVARDGSEGVSSATERRPDAIVLDGTSDADGVSTLQQLRRIDEGMNAAPIIMLAANMRQQQQALEHGANAIFDGGGHTNKVVQAVRHSLSTKRETASVH